ncbi:hypothetical protein AAC387_Pa09g1895 [Persea americana]
MAERIATPPIGIDLGTTNSCVAVWRKGRVEIIPNQQGNTDMRRYKGKDARAIMNPCDTSLNVKRLIGKEFSSTIAQDDKEHKQVSAVQKSSTILSNLCRTAGAFLKCRIKNVVISVPAWFNNSQRFAIVEAGKMANLEVMRIINEPTASAIAYGFKKIENDDDGANKKNVLIFNLGGDTLDVSILTMERGNYEVKATVADAFDDELMKHCIELEKESNLNLNPNALSSSEETSIDKDGLDNPNESLFHKCSDIVDKCLVDANMYRSSIHDVVLIGGSTRNAKVRQMLREIFDGMELSTGIDPNEAVASGAAIQAAILLGGMRDYIPELVVSDITTHSLGIRIGDLDEFMIPRKTVIPTTEKMNLTADQKKLPIKVYEGEEARIEDNYLLVESTLSNGAISFGPNDIIDVCFNVDENGIFTISIENKMPGQKKITMINWDLQGLKLEGEKMSSPFARCTEIVRGVKGNFKKILSPNQGP